MIENAREGDDGEGIVEWGLTSGEGQGTWWLGIPLMLMVLLVSTLLLMMSPSTSEATTAMSALLLRCHFRRC